LSRRCTPEIEARRVSVTMRTASSYSASDPRRPSPVLDGFRQAGRADDAGHRHGLHFFQHAVEI
jgi:hypothetical protein